MKRAAKLTLSALLSAMGVLVLLLSSVTTQLSLPAAALAGLFPAVAVLHAGLWWGVGSSAVTAALALLLLPEKTAAIWYLLFFGHYPIVKSLLEQIPGRVLSWLCKLLVFAACAAGLFFLFRSFFYAALPEQALWLLFAALAVGFVLYDIAFSALISFYSGRIAPHVDHSFPRR